MVLENAHTNMRDPLSKYASLLGYKNSEQPQGQSPSPCAQAYLQSLFVLEMKQGNWTSHYLWSELCAFYQSLARYPRSYISWLCVAFFFPVFFSSWKL